MTLRCHHVVAAIPALVAVYTHASEIETACNVIFPLLAHLLLAPLAVFAVVAPHSLCVLLSFRCEVAAWLSSLKKAANPSMSAMNCHRCLDEQQPVGQKCGGQGSGRQATASEEKRRRLGCGVMQESFRQNKTKK